MKKGEIYIFAGIGLLVVGSIVVSALRSPPKDEQSTSIPFYTDAPEELQKAGSALIKELNCRSCHALWTMRDPGQAVPAPALDGMGSLKSEDWLFSYLSAVNPQSVVPSRLKKEYQMPSYAALPEAERRTLAAYLASLKVKDWYLDEARSNEIEKLTGKAPEEPTKAENP